MDGHVFLHSRNKEGGKLFKVDKVIGVKYDKEELKYEIKWENTNMPNAYFGKDRLVNCVKLIGQFMLDNPDAVSNAKEQAEAKKQAKGLELSSSSGTLELPKSSKIVVKPLSADLAATIRSKSHLLGKRPLAPVSVNDKSKSRIPVQGRAELSMKRDQKQLNDYGRSMHPGVVANPHRMPAEFLSLKLSPHIKSRITLIECPKTYFSLMYTTILNPLSIVLKLDPKKCPLCQNVVKNDYDYLKVEPHCVGKCPFLVPITCGIGNCANKIKNPENLVKHLRSIHHLDKPYSYRDEILRRAMRERLGDYPVILRSDLNYMRELATEMEAGNVNYMKKELLEAQADLDGKYEALYSTTNKNAQNTPRPARVKKSTTREEFVEHEEDEEEEKDLFSCSDIDDEDYTVGGKQHYRDGSKVNVSCDEVQYEHDKYLLDSGDRDRVENDDTEPADYKEMFFFN